MFRAHKGVEFYYTFLFSVKNWIVRNAVRACCGEKNKKNSIIKYENTLSGPNSSFFAHNRLYLAWKGNISAELCGDWRHGKEMWGLFHLSNEAIQPHTGKKKGDDWTEKLSVVWFIEYSCETSLSVSESLDQVPEKSTESTQFWFLHTNSSLSVSQRQAYQKLKANSASSGIQYLDRQEQHTVQPARKTSSIGALGKD